MRSITSTTPSRRHKTMLLATMAASLLLATACGDDGPTYPDVFDPVAIQGDLAVAAAALEDPATQSFAAVGFMIDFALSGLDGAPLAVEAPALLLEGPLKRRSATSIATRLRRSAELREADPVTADAIPASALGKTFVYDPETMEYVMGAATGAPANGVRFLLYAVDPMTEMPVQPLVQTGHVDLTRTATGSSATARVEVYAGGASLVKVLDYSAQVAGSVTSPRIEVEGFARNGENRVDFTLATAFSLADESLNIDWRTEVPTAGLITRLNQSMNGGENPSFGIDAAVVSPSGRIDIDGTINDLSGGSLVVKVNGQTFATMQLSSGEDEEPTILNASGQPLTEEEQQTLLQVFEWFASAFFVFFVLLAPVGTLLDAAF